MALAHFLQIETIVKGESFCHILNTTLLKIGGFIMGAAGNKKSKKPKDKNHVPAYEKEEQVLSSNIGIGKKTKK